MAIPFQKVRYQIMGGVDSKIDGVVLPAPRLQVAENVYSDKTGSLRRRFGRTMLAQTDINGVSVGNLVASGKHQERILAFDQNSLYDYADGADRWVDKGRATSWRITSDDVSSESLGAANGPCMDVGVSGAYRCYVYDTYQPSGANTISAVAITVMDDQGARYADGQVLSTVTGAAAVQSSCKVVGFGARLYVVYIDMVTRANLKCFIIDTTSAATISSSLAAASTTLDTVVEATAPTLDMTVSTVYGPCAVYRTTTANQIKWGLITTAGALTSTSTQATTGNAVAVCADCTGGGVFGFGYANGSTPNDFFALIRTWNGSAWSATATSTALDTTLASSGVQISCHFAPGTTTLRIWYVRALTTYNGIRQATLTSAGVQTSNTGLITRSLLASRPFTGSDSVEYCWVISEPAQGITQPTFYLMTQDGDLAGWAHQGSAVYGSFSSIGGFSHVVEVVDATGNNRYRAAVPHFVRIGTKVSLSPTGAIVGTGTSGVASDLSVETLHSDSHVSIFDGQCTYIPSGFLQQYDGTSCTEVGFGSFVDNANRTTITASNSTGSLTVAAIYSYHIVPEWTNALGEREQGTDNGSKTLTMGAADDTNTIVVDCIPWTRKKSPRQNLVFAVYRTLANPTADSAFYRVGFVENDPAGETVTFVDTMSDATAAVQEQFRVSTELDPIAPPASSIIAAGNGRVFLSGLESDPNLVWYSKTRGHGQALEFSDALVLPIPESTGRITAMCVMNEALFVFTTRAIYRISGDGLNNLGFGSFSNPQVIVTDQGADGPRGVCLTPLGIVFESDDRVQLLAPSGGVDYIGAPMEGLTAPGNVTGICVVPDLMQIRVSYAATTHVFDYHHRQWYVFTHASVGPTCLWNGVHAAVMEDGIVYDNPAVWSDAGGQYAIDIKLGWQTLPESLQSNLRFQWVGLVGTALAAANLTVDFYHDFNSTTLSQSEAETISGAGVLRYQWRPNKQVADALMVRIHDGFLDVYGEYIPQNTAGFRLNEVVFVVGLRERPLRRID